MAAKHFAKSHMLEAGCLLAQAILHKTDELVTEILNKSVATQCFSDSRYGDHSDRLWLLYLIPENTQMIFNLMMQRYDLQRCVRLIDRAKLTHCNLTLVKPLYDFAQQQNCLPLCKSIGAMILRSQGGPCHRGLIVAMRIYIRQKGRVSFNKLRYCANTYFK